MTPPTMAWTVVPFSVLLGLVSGGVTSLNCTVESDSNGVTYTILNDFKALGRWTYSWYNQSGFVLVNNKQPHGPGLNSSINSLNSLRCLGSLTFNAHLSKNRTSEYIAVCPANCSTMFRHQGEKSKDGLSTTELVLAVFGGAAGLALLVLIIVGLLKYRKKKKKSRPNPGSCLWHKLEKKVNGSTVMIV